MQNLSKNHPVLSKLIISKILPVLLLTSMTTSLSSMQRTAHLARAIATNHVKPYSLTATTKKQKLAAASTIFTSPTLMPTITTSRTMSTATSKTNYEILGVSKDASIAEIKTAYRKLALKYHPDTNPGNLSAADNFRKISEVYQTLLASKNKGTNYFDEWFQEFEKQQAKERAEWAKKQAEWAKQKAERQAEREKYQAEWDADSKKRQAEWDKEHADSKKRQAEWAKKHAEWAKEQAEWAKEMAGYEEKLYLCFYFYTACIIVSNIKEAITGTSVHKTTLESKIVDAR